MAQTTYYNYSLKDMYLLSQIDWKPEFFSHAFYEDVNWFIQRIPPMHNLKLANQQGEFPVWLYCHLKSYLGFHICFS